MSAHCRRLPPAAARPPRQFVAQPPVPARSAATPRRKSQSCTAGWKRDSRQWRSYRRCLPHAADPIGKRQQILPHKRRWRHAPAQPQAPAELRQRCRYQGQARNAGERRAFRGRWRQAQTKHTAAQARPGERANRRLEHVRTLAAPATSQRRAHTRKRAPPAGARAKASDQQRDKLLHCTITIPTHAKTLDRPTVRVQGSGSRIQEACNVFSMLKRVQTRQRAEARFGCSDVRIRMATYTRQQFESPLRATAMAKSPSNSTERRCV